MDRHLKTELHAHFSAIENPSDDEKRLLSQLTASIEFFQVTAVCRDDLRGRGFDVSNVDDSDMDSLASKLSDDYCNQLYWQSLDIIAEDSFGIHKYKCPQCGEEAGECDLDTKICTCDSCDNEWVPLNLEVKETIDYHNIESATYAPLTKAWSITDKGGKVQSGVCTKDENESKKAGVEGDEEWYITLDLDNEIELVISPDVLSAKCSENCKERYEGVQWLITVQRFDQCTKLCELSSEQVTIEL